jgi:1,4-dihydroxy-2-naphthoyl-CoA synthase
VALVEYAVADGVAHVELNRPDAANAFDLETARELACAAAATKFVFAYPGIEMVKGQEAQTRIARFVGR